MEGRGLLTPTFNCPTLTPVLGIVLGSGGANVSVRHLDCGLRGSQGRDDVRKSVPETRTEQNVMAIWGDRILNLPEELFFLLKSVSVWL